MRVTFLCPHLRIAGGVRAILTYAERLARCGHAVTVIYLTRGERGIRDKTLDEAARIRSAEGEAACKIIGAKPVFFGQIDGATEINRKRVEDFTTLLAAENPDVVLTQWPIDTHLDHQVASLLTMRACMLPGIMWDYQFRAVQRLFTGPYF